ncbi:hypothetical protein, partial [Terrabacter sp. 2RAF25]|uniref:hypothetical protein n=1 Tax=Terrabacter sp. 2RAF25 TaxID=3232998 RepID=UPI003F959C5F
MGEKYPLATLLVVGFGGLLVGISGTAIAFGAYITGTRELAINENSYFQVLNNLRVGYAQIPSNSQRLAELQKLKEIVDIGYRQHLLNNLDADIRSTEEKLFEEVSAATREQLEAVLTKQNQARLLA